MTCVFIGLSLAIVATLWHTFKEYFKKDSKQKGIGVHHG